VQQRLAASDRPVEGRPCGCRTVGLSLGAGRLGPGWSPRAKSTNASAGNWARAMC